MAGASLLALLDDISTVLDDVAILSKLAAKKSAGVLGDDLALNAQQVTGVTAARELPVVWAVARGSFINKAILVPAALAIGAFAPWAITPLLMLGGAFLCYEGCEKLAHRFLHPPAAQQAERAARTGALADPEVDLVAFEREKIKGAVRTDFILSAEIIAITLGVVAAAGFVTQAVVLSAVAIAMTIGVYGFVAGIVKLDDLGLYWSRAPGGLRRAAGNAVLWLAPWLMKALSIVGTAAMFLVGGGILVHGVPPLHHLLEGLSASLGGIAGWLAEALANGAVGIVAGAIVLAAVLAVRRFLPGRTGLADEGAH
ncbi:MAG: DUF808 domain-containing protein [bacterium]|jgi:hypothetical protein|nr:DUF808 domain-containing protein [Betaproteobacteria bacterium]